MKRASYKTGYGQRQHQREFIARLLQRGFTAPFVAAYAAREYNLDVAQALKVVRYVQGSLSRVEHWNWTSGSQANVGYEVLPN